MEIQIELDQVLLPELGGSTIVILIQLPKLYSGQGMYCTGNLKRQNGIIISDMICICFDSFIVISDKVDSEAYVKA